MWNLKFKAYVLSMSLCYILQSPVDYQSLTPATDKNHFSSQKIKFTHFGHLLPLLIQKSRHVFFLLWAPCKNTSSITK